MSNYAGQIGKVVSLLFKSLRPIFVIFFIMLVLFAALFTYDRFQTIKDKDLAAILVQNLDVKASCTSPLVNPKEKVEFKFTFDNENDQPLLLTDMGIDTNLLGTEGRTYSTVLQTTPDSKKNGLDGKFTLYHFDSAVEIPPKSTKEVTVKLQTAPASESKAKPKTLVTYEGEISFLIDPEIDSRAGCKLQVRYP